MIPDPLPDAASPSETSYLAIDPGDTVGFAQFDHSGLLLHYGQFKAAPEYLRRLVHEGLKRVIVEDYRNHPNMRQPTWSRNNTSKLIGQIEMICELRNLPKVVLQSNTVLQIGYLWAGLEEKPSNHSISHQFDAVAHGTYWLVRNNIKSVASIIPKELDKSNDKK